MAGLAAVATVLNVGFHEGIHALTPPTPVASPRRSTAELPGHILSAAKSSL
jgi:hypothetical protein